MNKNITYYIKSIFEIVMLVIFFLCLIGFISSFIIMIWNLPLCIYIMGYSVSIGFINFLFMISWDYGWKEDYV